MTKKRLFVSLMVVSLLVCGCGVFVAFQGFNKIGELTAKVTPADKTVSQNISTGGGSVMLDKLSVTIPPNTVQANTQITVSKELPANEVTEKNKVNQVEKDATTVSSVYSISNEKPVIMQDSSNPIYINIPYDKTKIPEDKQTSAKTYAMIWNGTTYEPAFGEIDKENGVLKIPLTALPSKDVSDTKIMVVTSDNWEMVTKESLGTKALPFFPTEEKVSDKYFEVIYIKHVA